MRHPIISSLGLAILVGISLVSPTLAVVSIDYVSVGNANNLADPLNGYGAVGFAYNIGKYEVTNAQYCEFLNAKGASNNAGIFKSGILPYYGITQSGSSGGYTYSVTSGQENLPVVYVTWFDAARFTNWLSNGQGNGSMETGAYTLNGVTSGIVTVNVGATVYIPSEDEWHKAAYYNGGTSTYSLYPNGQNAITTADANYNNPYGGPTDVGYGTPSFYGTFGQGGNACEWNDAVFYDRARGVCGGSYYAIGGVSDMYAGAISTDDPSNTYRDRGFRVVSVPEPSCLVLTIIASGVLATRRKR